MLIKLPHIILLTAGLMLSAAPSGLAQSYVDVDSRSVASSLSNPIPPHQALTPPNRESHLEQRGYDTLVAYEHSQARGFGELDDDEGLDARGFYPPSFSPGLQRRSELVSKLASHCHALLNERNPVGESRAPRHSWRYDQERLQKRGRSRAGSVNEDWTKVSDKPERNRIQNRIPQRNYRKKTKRVKQHTGTTGKSGAGSKRPTTPASHK
ncbi:hypothetical protein NMY22_g6549 [Coprinellus aureogranulatus]|nr:hypothetical protein NMY22_g6549 [Coprinellus aureogranulatus]